MLAALPDLGEAGIRSRAGPALHSEYRRRCILRESALRQPKKCIEIPWSPATDR